MNQRITRRRFGQLAIAGTAVTGLSYLATKTLAQTPNLVVLGVRPGGVINVDTTAVTEVNSTELDTPTTFSSSTTASTNRELILQSLDIVSGQVQTVQSYRFLQDGTTPVLQSAEQISDFTYLGNGTPVLAITPVSTSRRGQSPTRLILLNSASTAVTTSGLNRRQKLESILGTNDGRLIGLVTNKNGTPPVRLVDIDTQTGRISFTDRVVIPGGNRFGTLAQCPNGNIYTTTVGRRGVTRLVQLNLGQRRPVTGVELRFEGRAWNNGSEGLICSPAGQLFLFGARRYETPNYLHTVDLNTGVMTRIQPAFNVAKITRVLA